MKNIYCTPKGKSELAVFVPHLEMSVDDIAKYMTQNRKPRIKYKAGSIVMTSDLSGTEVSLQEFIKEYNEYIEMKAKRRDELENQFMADYEAQGLEKQFAFSDPKVLNPNYTEWLEKKTAEALGLDQASKGLIRPNEPNVLGVYISDRPSSVLSHKADQLLGVFLNMETVNNQRYVWYKDDEGIPQYARWEDVYLKRS